MAETMTVEELIEELRFEAGIPPAPRDLLIRAADALEAGLRVAKPFAMMAAEVEAWQRGANPTFPGHFDAADLNRARDWTKGIYT